MNRNVILKTFDEVRYFHKRILFAVTLKEKVTFLILSNEPIFDIENLRNYLIENELNHFAKNEIINLIELIDSFLKFEKSYNEIPKSENHYSYEYPTKGKGVGSGNLMYILKVNNQFLKSNEIDFNLKEPLYSRLKSLNYFNISSRLLEIKDLFATYLEQPKQTTTIITDIEKKEIDKKYLPNGFPYKVKTFDPYSYSNSKRFDEPFESLQEYEATVKNVRHINGLRFFHLIKGLNETDFINEINNQYLNYTLENTENSKHWLSLTYDLVLKGFSVAGKIDDVSLRGAFIKWYNITLNGLEPQQPKAVIPDEVKPKKEWHNQIFKDNAFEFWERLFENLNINETKRTDLRFMYEIMKYKEQIHKTVTVKNITDWINETYQFSIDKLQYTSIKSKSNENRMSIYNLIK